MGKEVKATLTYTVINRYGGALTIGWGDLDITMGLTLYR